MPCIDPPTSSSPLFTPRTHSLSLPNIRPPQPPLHLLRPFPSLRPTLCPRPAIPLPVQPTPPILAHILIPRLLRQLRGRTTPHARLAIKHNLLIQRGFLEPEAVFEFLGGEQQRVGLRGDGDVERCGDAVCGELGGFADVDEEGGG